MYDSCQDPNDKIEEISEIKIWKDPDRLFLISYQDPVNLMSYTKFKLSFFWQDLDWFLKKFRIPYSDDANWETDPDSVWNLTGFFYL
jgi:hypothetical protein